MLFYRPTIRCPNCQYRGKASVQDAGCLVWIGIIAVGLAGIFCWPLFLVVPLLMLWAVFFSVKAVCPRCGWKNVAKT